MKKFYRIEWKKGYAKRYYIEGTGISIQIGKYRSLDKFDRDMKTKPTWHGKWYVDVLNYGSPKLFNTEKQAKAYLKKVMLKVYKTKRLDKRKRR